MQTTILAQVPAAAYYLQWHEYRTQANLIQR